MSSISVGNGAWAPVRDPTGLLRRWRRQRALPDHERVEVLLAPHPGPRSAAAPPGGLHLPVEKRLAQPAGGLVAAVRRGNRGRHERRPLRRAHAAPRTASAWSSAVTASANW